MLHMSDDPNPYGPRLMAYVDAQLEHRTESPTAFAVQRVGVSASQFGRWRSGEVLPRLDTIIEIAEALGRPALEALAHAAGVVDQLAEPLPPQAHSLEECIEGSDLQEPYRGIILDVLQSVRKYERGVTEVTTSSKRRRAEKRPRRTHG